MDEIIASIRRVTDIMSEITAASNEQSQGIEQVNLAITQMDDMTQQNAALVELAAESLEQEAHNLAVSVGAFRMDSHASGMGASGVTRSVPARISIPAGHAASARRPPKVERRAPIAIKAGHHRKPQIHGADGEWAKF